MNELHELSNIYNLQLLCCRVLLRRKVDEISRLWQFCDMKNVTRYFVVGSVGVLMTRRDILGLAVKWLKAVINY